ncbi:MAG: ROK family transcriptional regulator, partial [Bifidobacteriaceae bacterium]|nr:ROK family transcriptional regulator [Bifidobacteriaceae bacterium]
MPSTGGPAVSAVSARPHRLNGGRGEVVKGARQESLRRHNLAVVYQLVAAASEPLSRAEIAERADVTRATATSLVDQLVAARLVEELDARVSGRAGRPATPVRPARGTVVGLGLEVNVDYLGVRAIDLAGTVVGERVRHGDLAGSQPAETLTRLARAARTVRTAVMRRGARIAGAALAVPGPVDRPLGPLRLAPNLGWADVDVAGILNRLLAATPLVRVDNEASLAARAELHARARLAGTPGCALPGEPPGGGFIYVSGGIGIGAGIVEASGMYAGAHGWAGELGHVAVYPDGRPCRCGATGCLEQYAGRRAIAVSAGMAADASTEDLRVLAEAKNREVLSALNLAGTALGIALAGAVNLVDIPAVVLG